MKNKKKYVDECINPDSNNWRKYRRGGVVMAFNATFNSISAISWQSVLVVRKPEYPVKITDQLQVT
jgi:hypothetical protein